MTLVEGAIPRGESAPIRREIGGSENTERLTAGK
jgi:hypothetical protein